MELPISDVMLRHRNVGATMDLIIPVNIICNTPDDVLINNIKHNSRLDKVWLAAEDEHDGVAVICGSGPSVADHLDEIRQLQADGAEVFALNGCAKFLDDNGIFPDYQVMCDARDENVQLIGPAAVHLFASQCSPKLFEQVPSAMVWHLQIGDIEQYFPEYRGPYALIGGAASVGNTATCLAYAMGYRKLHLYGYDSCHRDNKGHAFDQPLNAGDPVLWTQYNGKKYLTSFTMKHQAEKFQETARALRQMGTEIHVHGTGLLPDMWNSPKEELSEEEKYSRMWDIEGYSAVSPGELEAQEFLNVVQPPVGSSIADFGCGTGRGGLTIKKIVDCDVTLIDFTENSRDEEAMQLPFLRADLTQPIKIKVDYGYCTDVMEHIHPDNVRKVIQNIMKSCRVGCFFQISTIPDSMGALIGQDLHLTVQPHKWWRALFYSIGCVVRWEREADTTANFYILNRR